LKVHEFNDLIVFWRWLTAKKLAMVTARSVYHWNMEGNEAPLKIFDRSGPLAEQNA
jgi:clathrin heavy chain